MAADPPTLRERCRALRRAGFAVDGARTPRAAADALAEGVHDALVVEALGPPAGRHRPVDAGHWSDDAGLALMGAAGPEVAVVVVTGPDRAGARAGVLAVGADDVMTPPFTVAELVLRVAKALVRRTELDGAAVVEVGPVQVDRARRRVTRDGVVVALTSTETCVLDHLVAHRYRLVSEAELLDHCWDARRDPFSNPLPSQLNRLRRHLAEAVTIRFVDRGGDIVEPTTDRDLV